MPYGPWAGPIAGSRHGRLRVSLTGMSADPGLFGPDTVTWRLHADPLIGVAGLRALFLQALHPVAMAGVASNSAFREDPWGRLLRTAEYVGTVTYGTSEEAARAGAQVRGLHRRVRGVEPESGRAYRASDPDLLLWVHACLVDSILDTARRGGAALDDDDADAYVCEQVLLAELVGIPQADVPADAAELRDYFEGMRPRIRVTEEALSATLFMLLPPMHNAVALATPARPAWASLASLAFAAQPRWARRAFGLPGLAPTDLAATLALRALRTALLAVPAPLRDGPHLRAANARLSVAAAPDRRP